MESAHLAASTREILPLCLGCACPTSDAWYINPYFGVSCFALSARKSAFSAPRICTVEAGCFARFISDPACAISLAPTSSPTMIERLGAIACILFFRYSQSCVRYSLSSITCVHSMSTFAMSSSLTSVPIEISAASFISFSTSSASTSEKSMALHFVRTPIICTALAYIMLSGTIFPSSGKCHPYHSLSRMAYVFSSLSRSSRRPIACTIIVSTLSGLNLSLYLERECASPICIERISAGEVPSTRLSI
mmetsp:Transcript_6368/g.14143  ORF Transcript_6368/g.14143 Transcript_6368/m.14143 type:complete len:249 (-) Transcript_6368:399-1145(-)